MDSDYIGKNLWEKNRKFQEHSDEHSWNSTLLKSSSLKMRLQKFSGNPDDIVWSNIKHALIVDDLLFKLDVYSRLVASIILLFLFYFLEPTQYKTEISVNINNSIEDPMDLKESSKEQKTYNSASSEKNLSSGAIPLANGNNPIFNGIVKKAYHDKFSKTYNIPAIAAFDSVSHDSTALPQFDLEDTRQKFDLLCEHVNLDSTVVKNPFKTHEKYSSITSEEALTKHKPGGSVYMLLMPTLGYQQISPVKDDGILIESLKKVPTFSTKRLGIRVEIGYELKVKNHLSIIAGILYYQRKQSINYQYFDPADAEVKPLNENPMTFEVIAESKSQNFEYELKNIGVLSGINYEIRQNRFIHKFGAAIELHRGFSTLNRRATQAPAMYLFGDLNYRISYPLSQSFDFIIQPTLNYALQMSEKSSAPFYIKPYGLGLNWGISFHIRH